MASSSVPSDLQWVISSLAAGSYSWWMNHITATITVLDVRKSRVKIGVDALANAVKVTLGPKGRNVALDKKWGAPTITHDGVTVAKEIELEEPFQNMGAKMVKEISSKTSDVAGDGTTTATLLAEAVFNEGLRAVVAGVNPVMMKQGIEKAVADVAEKLKSMSIKVKSKED